jgi:hypothetical protein
LNNSSVIKYLSFLIYFLLKIDKYLSMVGVLIYIFFKSSGLISCTVVSFQLLHAVICGMWLWNTRTS